MVAKPLAISAASKPPVVIVGGGAAGCFTAACLASHTQVIILERSMHLLQKVRISGGGRCNVTHGCFDPKQLTSHYPRGHLALLGPFTRFQPRDTLRWFEERGVPLKEECDGRIFPESDSSESIIDCLKGEMARGGVEIRLGEYPLSIERTPRGFLLHLKGGEQEASALVLATGSHPEGHRLAKSLGHTIIPPVPSLFAFRLAPHPYADLSGVSVERIRMHLERSSLESEGPLLITHFGFSGPAALKLSAWGAPFFHACNYQTQLRIDWLPDWDEERFLALKRGPHGDKTLQRAVLPFPKSLWERLLGRFSFDRELKWRELSDARVRSLLHSLHADCYEMDGKSLHKEEFVSCGGVDLDEVNFKTLESRIVPRLYFAGEVLHIDGITGGFNFQNAWTTAWHTACSLKEQAQMGG